MWTFAVNGYSTTDVLAALRRGRRTWSYRYDLLDQSGTLKHALTGVVKGSCSVRQDATAKVQRTATVEFLEDLSIDWSHDRFRPWARLKMPDGGHAEWPCGTFLLSTPPRSAPNGTIRRQVECYDYNQIVIEDRVTDRYSLAAGTVVTTAIASLLTGAGLTAQNITASTATLPVARSWDMGTDKWTIIDALIQVINYRGLWFDAMGVAQVLPYIALTSRPVEYTYGDDSASVTMPGTIDAFDYFAVPNIFIGVVSQADRAPLASVYTNSNPASKTSTLARGRNIVAPPVNMDAVDQTTLDAAVARMAAELSQVNEAIQFETALMPMHANEDCYQFVHSRLGTNATFIESSWSMALAPGARMQHTAKAILPV